MHWRDICGSCSVSVSPEDGHSQGALGMDHLALINYTNGLQAPVVASSRAAGPHRAALLAGSALRLTGCECTEEGLS